MIVCCNLVLRSYGGVSKCLFIGVKDVFDLVVLFKLLWVNCFMILRELVMGDIFLLG